MLLIQMVRREGKERDGMVLSVEDCLGSEIVVVGGSEAVPGGLVVE